MIVIISYEFNRLWLTLMSCRMNHNGKTFVKKEEDENDTNLIVDEIRQIHPPCL